MYELYLESKFDYIGNRANVSYILMIKNIYQVFKCRACVASSAQTSSLISPMSNVVRVKLPMVPVNGKRPIVELVMMQGGKYQPIKFSNNMQVKNQILF